MTENPANGIKDVMWHFLMDKGQKENIPALKASVYRLIQMTTQKTAGQPRYAKPTHISWDTLDMELMRIVIEATALVLSGRLDELEEKDEQINRCRYEDLEEQGLLVSLPCKVGDDVYIIPSPSVYGLNIINGYGNLNRVYHQHIGSITFADSHWYATSREEYKVYSEKVLNDIAFGITWFTDREEAEKKLKELRE